MSSIVLDANVAIDWHIQSTAGDAYSLPLWDLCETGDLRFCVPEHFHYEVSRILISALFFGPFGAIAGTGLGLLASGLRGDFRRKDERSS